MEAVVSSAMKTQVFMDRTMCCWVQNILNSCGAFIFRVKQFKRNNQAGRCAIM